MSHPDADLHPVATGLAKDTVDKHAAEQPLKLFAGWFCPFVQRVWLALEEKGIPYQYIEGPPTTSLYPEAVRKLTTPLVNPYHKGPELMRINPRGLVPTLEIAPDKALYESTVLLEYLEEAYPDHPPALLPTDKFDRARSRIWTDFVTSRVIPAWHRFLQFQPSKFNDGPGRLKKLQEEYREKLLEFAREIHPTGPYFFGAELGTVDIVLAPWVLRHWVFDHFKGLGVGIPVEGKGGDGEEAWGRWRRWVKAMEGRETVRRTTSEKEFYLPIYQRYADDVAQSELAKATREGRGVP